MRIFLIILLFQNLFCLDQETYDLYTIKNPEPIPFDWCRTEIKGNTYYICGESIISSTHALREAIDEFRLLRFGAATGHYDAMDDYIITPMRSKNEGSGSSTVYRRMVRIEPK